MCRRWDVGVGRPGYPIQERAGLLDFAIRDYHSRVPLAYSVPPQALQLRPPCPTARRQIDAAAWPFRHGTFRVMPTGRRRGGAQPTCGSGRHRGCRHYLLARIKTSAAAPLGGTARPYADVRDKYSAWKIIQSSTPMGKGARCSASNSPRRDEWRLPRTQSPMT